MTWRSRILWAVVYLALIPVFAGLYTWKASSFYQSNVTHEAFYEHAAVNADVSVAEGIRRSIERMVPTHGGPMPGNELSVIQTSEVDSELTVEVAFPIDRGAKLSADQALSGQSEATLDVIIPKGALSEAYLRKTPDGMLHLPFRTAMTSSTDRGKVASSDLNSFLKSQTLDAEGPTLPLTPKEMWPIGFLAGASNGYVANLPGQYWRMLYFSAVTVTTLGYGDVVPVSTGARLLVTTEAILGVVTIGLFLNALTRRSDGGSGRPASRLRQMVRGTLRLGGNGN